MLAVYAEGIIQGSTVFGVEANAFEIAFKSTLSMEIDLQFFNGVLSRPFFQLIW